MMKSYIKDRILYVEVEGEFIADDLIRETGIWLKDHSNEYVGYIVDVRKMTKQTAIEQKKAEEAAKHTNTGKPRAVLGKDMAMAAVINIYMRFTNAKGIRYFLDEQEAREWLLNYVAG